jgi:pimeloyl-ACP methyl ester carboxylesterase
MFEKKRIKVGDNVVDVRSNFVANRQPVVLIHGVGVSGTYFLPFAEELAKKYAVYILDLPGYGKTPRPSQPLTISELADVVLDVTMFYKLKDTVLVGQSMGCQTATQIATKKPNLYKKLILLGPTVNRKERNRFMQGIRLFQDTFYEPFKLNMIIIGDYARMGPLRYLKTCKFMVGDHIEKNLTAVPLPTLIVRGGNDKIVPKDWVHFLSSVMSHSETKEIPGAPHNVQYTNPIKLANVCNDFIRK